ncbi:unnamed protein product [Amoebophrya sp. A25]|nr:unnamed protein product [Amoebophrya sp. A25]|eukprot:GSA25T00021712001.1
MASRPLSAPATPAPTQLQGWRTRRNEQLSFLVAYDGTIPTRNALNLCTDFFLKHKPAATLDVLHVYDPTVQQGLPYASKAKTLAGELDGHACVLGPHRYRSHVVGKILAEGDRATLIGKTVLQFTEKTAALAAQAAPAAAATRLPRPAYIQNQVGLGHLNLEGGNVTSKEQSQELSPTGEEEQLASSKYVDFLVLGFKATRRFKSVDEVLLSSSIHHCMQNASCSLVIVRNRFDPGAFAKHMSVSEVLAKRRFQKYDFFGGTGGVESQNDAVQREIAGEAEARSRGCHILVCVDGNPWSEKAISDALRLSGIEKSAFNEARNDKITILHIVKPEVVSICGGDSAQQTEDGERPLETPYEHLAGGYAGTSRTSSRSANTTHRSEYKSSEQYYRKMVGRWVERNFREQLVNDELADDRSLREREARLSVQRQAVDRARDKAEIQELEARRTEWADREVIWEQEEQARQWTAIKRRASTSGARTTAAAPPNKSSSAAEQEEPAARPATAARGSKSTVKKPGELMRERDAPVHRRSSVRPATAADATKRAGSSVVGSRNSSNSKARSESDYLVGGTQQVTLDDNSGAVSVSGGSTTAPSSNAGYRSDSGNSSLDPSSSAAAGAVGVRKVRSAVQTLRLNARLWTIRKSRKHLTRDEKLAKMLSKIEFRTKAATAGRSVAQDILQFAESENVNLLCMGTDAGRLKKLQSYLGSVAAHVLCESDIPVVIARYDEKTFSGLMDSKSRAHPAAPAPSKLEAATTVGADPQQRLAF